MRAHFWRIMSWTRARDSPMPPQSRSALPKPSLQSEKVTAESDSPAEEAGFELLVPPGFGARLRWPNDAESNVAHL
jgi:hypothetical protein